MKLNHLKFFVVLSLTLIFGCSSKEEQKPEVRFVDLQGKARSIKTRVPEANAKIMSGQSYNYNSQQSNPEIHNEYLENKKNSLGIASPKDKDLITQKNNFTPKFTDSDTYTKNPPISQSKIETEKSQSPFPVCGSEKCITANPSGKKCKILAESTAGWQYATGYLHQRGVTYVIHAVGPEWD